MCMCLCQLHSRFTLDTCAVTCSGEHHVAITLAHSTYIQHIYTAHMYIYFTLGEVRAPNVHAISLMHFPANFSHLAPRQVMSSSCATATHQPVAPGSAMA